MALTISLSNIVPNGMLDLLDLFSLDNHYITKFDHSKHSLFILSFSSGIKKEPLGSLKCSAIAGVILEPLFENPSDSFRHVI